MYCHNIRIFPFLAHCRIGNMQDRKKWIIINESLSGFKVPQDFCFHLAFVFIVRGTDTGLALSSVQERLPYMGTESRPSQAKLATVVGSVSLGYRQ